VLLYFCCNKTAAYGAITVLAISFLASYVAIWLELIEGLIDKLYMKCYEIITEYPNDTDSSDADDGDSADSVSDL
jgi:hypothetical protein